VSDVDKTLDNARRNLKEALDKASAAGDSANKKVYINNARAWEYIVQKLEELKGS